MTIDTPHSRAKPTAKRSRLEPFQSQIFDLKTKGYADWYVRDWLESQGLKVSAESVRKFIKTRTIATAQASTTPKAAIKTDDLLLVSKIICDIDSVHESIKNLQESIPDLSNKLQNSLAERLNQLIEASNAINGAFYRKELEMKNFSNDLLIKITTETRKNTNEALAKFESSIKNTVDNRKYAQNYLSYRIVQVGFLLIFIALTCMFFAYLFIDVKREKEDQKMIEVGKIAIVNFDKLDKKLVMR